MLTLHTWLHWATAAGYAFLFVELIRSGAMWRLQFFWVWTAAMALWLMIWEPYNVPKLVSLQPMLLSLRVCVVIEAFVLVTRGMAPRERRWIFLVMLACAAAGIRVTFGYIQGDRPLDWYLAIKQHAHLGLAIAALFSGLAIWNKPPRLGKAFRNHGLILIFYSLTDAAIGFVKGPSMGDQMIAVRCLFWAVSLLCMWMWLGWVLPEFKPRHPVLKVSMGR